MFRLSLLALCVAGPFLPADAFDRYTNTILAAAVEKGEVREVPELTPDLLAEHGRVLPGQAAAFVVVRTNENRLAKLLVTPARQKVGPEAVPLLLVERFVTFKDGTERAIQAKGEAVSVYAGFRLHLDLGQIVPAALGGDLEVQAAGPAVRVKPLGKAKLYLVTKELPAASAPAKLKRPEVGAKFENRFFTGTYQMYDDGRRSGTLVLEATDAGEITGSFTSDKDGEKYEVKGSVGVPNHAATFAIRFPRTEVLYEGRLFTADAGAIAGTAKLLGRDTAFYAVRKAE